MVETQNSVFSVVDRFSESLGKVEALMTFDDIILEFVLARLEPVASHQKTIRYVPPEVSVMGLYELIKNVRQNESMRDNYAEIYNQSLVLVVSHFTSAARSLFTAAIENLIQRNHLPRKLQQQKLDVPIGALIHANTNLGTFVASQLIAREDMSFQDMQGINRAFRDFCGHDPVRNNHVNNIIVGQAYRHAIVHNGAVIDSQLVNQLSQCSPRDVREIVTLDELIRMTPREVRLIGRSMKVFLASIADRFPISQQPPTP